ncbi:TIGR00645 family protein [Methylomagnum ishizawai]|uniref:TIGR00645 family protein n=1 Tax=Methylomagnum ishizawai TaxID=1760988 RepID=UPI001C333E09|nr:TIGR00645 family protein [Methylomagnum ishizawai]BBL75235.1 UPF0114 protein YqhA [Methylomagnum ishizawai]
MTVEHLLERCMYASRWLLAPIYLGMSLGLIALGLKFFQEAFHVLPHVLETAEEDLVLTVLSLIDMVLVGSLLVMVMISGYENSVSQLELTEDTERLGWLGKLDSGSLKMKVAASIVAISSIHLLKVFMNVERMPDDKIMWSIFLHLTFVVSAYFMAVIDKITKHGHGDSPAGSKPH